MDPDLWKLESHQHFTSVSLHSSSETSRIAVTLSNQSLNRRRLCRNERRFRLMIKTASWSWVQSCLGPDITRSPWLSSCLMSRYVACITPVCDATDSYRKLIDAAVTG